MNIFKAARNSILIRSTANAHRYICYINGKLRSFQTHEKDFDTCVAMLFGALNSCMMPAGQMTRVARLAMAGLASAMLVSGNPAMALPTGYEVVEGEVQFHQPDPFTLNISSNSLNSIINYQSFDILHNETVNFMFMLNGSSALNRILGGGATNIMGALNANGNIFLVNPAGINFGASAQVNVGSLFATTLNISNQDFMNGKYIFKNDGGFGAVINDGDITVKPGGFAVLAGSAVENNGTITAPIGQIHLAVGDQVTMTVADGLAVNVTVDEILSQNVADYQDAIKNAGTLQADGGLIKLQALLQDNLYLRAVNNEGRVQAQSVAFHDGAVEFLAPGAGLVDNSGIVDVSGTVANADAGSFVMNADSVLNTGDVDASGAEGGKGGDVRMLGDEVRVIGDAKIDASGDAGGGSILIGGDYQGGNGIRTSEFTGVGQSVTLDASAGSNGDGGKVIAWSDGSTLFYGNIDISGGSESGNGGFAEVSGVEGLEFDGNVSANAANGQAGKLLLDPRNITIIQGTPSSNNNSALDGDNKILQSEGGNNDFRIGTAKLESLAGNVDIELQAKQNIFVQDLSDPLAFQTGNNKTVTFKADTDTSDGVLGGFYMLDLNDQITTQGGNIKIEGGHIFVGELLSKGGNITLDTTGSGNTGTIFANRLSTGTGDGDATATSGILTLKGHNIYQGDRVFLAQSINIQATGAVQDAVAAINPTLIATGGSTIDATLTGWSGSRIAFYNSMPPSIQTLIVNYGGNGFWNNGTLTSGQKNDLKALIGSTNLAMVIGGTTSTASSVSAVNPTVTADSTAYRLNTTSLTVNAAEAINLTNANDGLTLNASTVTNQLQLSTAGGLTVAGEVKSNNGSVTLASEGKMDVNANVSGKTGVSLTADSDNNNTGALTVADASTVSTTNTKAYLEGHGITVNGQVSTGSGEIELNSSASITDSNTGAISLLNTGNLILTSNGQIGTPGDSGNKLNIQVGNITAQSNGGTIDLHETGNMHIQDLDSNGGHTTLRATGNIEDAGLSSTINPAINVGSGTLHLIAENGGIGTEDALNVSAGDITAHTNNKSINIYETGDMIISNLDSIGGAVTLRATGDINDNNSHLFPGEPPIDTQGGGGSFGSLSLTSDGGSIGNDDPLNIRAGSVSASTNGGSINLYESGSMEIGEIDSDNGAVTLRATGNINDVNSSGFPGNPPVDAGSGALSITSDSGSIGNEDPLNIRGGSLTAQTNGGSIDLYEAGSMSVADLNSNNGNVTLRATGDIEDENSSISNPPIDAGTGSLSLTSDSGHLGADDSDPLNIRAGSLTAQTNNKKINLYETGDMSVADLNSNGGNVTLRATGDIEDENSSLINPPIDAGSGKLTLLSDNGHLGADDNDPLNIRAGSVIAQTDNKKINLYESGDMSVADLNSNGGNVILRATGDIEDKNSSVANPPIDAGSGALSLISDGGHLGADNNDPLNIRGGSITAQTNNKKINLYETGNMTIANLDSNNGTVNLRATGDINDENSHLFPGEPPVDAGTGALSLTSDSGSIGNNDPLNIRAGTLTAHTDGGDIDIYESGSMNALDVEAMNGANTAGGFVRLAATDDITNTSGATIRAGEDLTLDAGRDIFGFGTLLAEKLISLDAGRDIQTGSSSRIESFNGDVSLLAQDDIENGADITGGNITLTANNVNISDGFVNGIKVTSTASLNARSQVLLDSARDIQLNGDITANRRITLDADRNINVGSSSEVRSNDRSVLFLADGDIENNGQITADNNIRFQAGNDIDNDGQLSAGNDIRFRAGNDIDNDGFLFAGNDIRFRAGNDIDNDGFLIAFNDIRFRAVDDIENNGLVGAAGRIRFRAGEEIENNGFILSFGTSRFRAGTDIDNNGLIASGRNVLFRAGDEIDNDGIIFALNRADLEAVSNITGSGMTIGKTVDLFSSNGSIGNSASQRFNTSSQSLFANAPTGSVYINEHLNNTGVVSLGASGAANDFFLTLVQPGDLSVDGGVTATDVRLITTGSSIFVNSNIEGFNHVLLSAALNGNITGPGLISGENVNLLGVNGNIDVFTNATNLTANTGGNVNISEANSVNLGNSSAGGTFTMLTSTLFPGIYDPHGNGTIVMTGATFGNNGVHLNAAGSILDGNGDAVNLIANDTSSLLARGGVIGTLADGLDVLVNGGDLFVGATQSLNGVSVNINGVVNPSDTLRPLFIPPGAVIFNGRYLFGGGPIQDLLTQGIPSLVNDFNYMNGVYRILKDSAELMGNDTLANVDAKIIDQRGEPQPFDLRLIEEEGENGEPILNLMMAE